MSKNTKLPVMVKPGACQIILLLRKKTSYQCPNIMLFLKNSKVLVIFSPKEFRKVKVR